MRWLTANGWRPEKALQLAHFPATARGLRCLERISKGQVLVSIPVRLMITREVALRRFGDDFCRMDTHTLLALFLLVEKAKGEESFWNAYLLSLPETYEVPCFCTADEILLFPTYLRRNVEEMRRMVLSRLSAVNHMLAGQLKYSENDWMWAWMTVNTRAVYFERERLHADRLALAPFLDMFNHSPDVGVRTGVDLGRDCYQIVAEDSTDRFGEVFINYGPHGNTKLLLEYGFCVPNNPHDSVPLVLDELCQAIPVQASSSVREVLRGAKLADNLCITKEGLSWNALACLEILRLDSEGMLEKWRSVFQDDRDSVVCQDLSSKVLLAKLDEVQSSLLNLSGNTKCTDGCVAVIGLLRLHQVMLEEALKQTSLL